MTRPPLQPPTYLDLVIVVCAFVLIPVLIIFAVSVLLYYITH